MGKLRTALFDIEANGFQPTVIHCMVIMEAESNFKLTCRTPLEIQHGLRILEQADTAVAHYGLGYDFPVIERLGGYRPKEGQLRRDSLVMCQMLFGDIKETFDLAAKAAAKDRKAKDIVIDFEFKGRYLGSHSLEAWGYRLGKSKGDYAEIMKKQGLDPWAEVNDEMVEYCEDDVAVLKKLWNTRIVPAMEEGDIAANLRAASMEHFMAKAMHELRHHGIHFDVKKARSLAEELEKRRVELEIEIRDEFGGRFEPTGGFVRRPNPMNAGRYTKNQLDFPSNTMWYHRYHDDLLIDGQCRELWGKWRPPPKRETSRARAIRALAKMREEPPSPEMDIKIAAKQAKLDQLPADPPPLIKIALEDGFGPTITEGSFTPIKYRKVSIGSRKQVARRLLEMGWVPEEFTETGDPTLSETSLEKLAEGLPIAKKLVLYYTIVKRLGQLRNGAKAWLKVVSKKGVIHPTIRPCATVTARATHSGPNVSQVPAINFVTDPATGKPVVAWGEEGAWGADCRALYTVPKGFKQVGADLAGIELRGFAEVLFDFDKGKFFDVLMNEDFHERNRVILGLSNRTDAKRFIFAWMYGSGDLKLGALIYPTATAAVQKAAGKTFRERITKGIDGVASLLRFVKKQIRQRNQGHQQEAASNTGKYTPRGVGVISAIDGRLLGVRGMHSALNTLLQSFGAIVAKYWIYMILNEVRARKWKIGYDGDYVFMIWSHDEVQFAVREGLEYEMAEICEQAAINAGKALGLRIPINAEAKIGNNWQETH